MKFTFRIFLSSTFGDFQAEREALKAVAWPQLEAYCASRGASFEVVDLRWGISESDGLAHDTVRICLDEIVHCQDLSPKPNFIMLLGDRYGWRPLPPEIPSNEFAHLLATLGDAPVEDINLLNEWYLRDDNATPAQYILRPRGDAYRAYAQWQPVEYRLLRILRTCAEKLGLTPERRERYLYSATHQEIVRGALAIDDADKHVFACIRDIWKLDANAPEARRFSDFDATGQLDADAKQLRAELRQQVEAFLPKAHCFPYQAQWQGQAHQPISTGHIEKLCADVLISLRRVIDRELDTQVGDALDQEIDRHREAATERARIFVGRKSSLAQLGVGIRDILNRTEDGTASSVDTTRSFLVHGPGGNGKSAFLARALVDIRRAHPAAIVIQRFVGLTPHSTDLISFLQDLLTELSRRYGQDETLPEGELKHLIDALPKRLAWASADQPLILVIDALDQFNDSFQVHQQQWLPKELPTHVVLVVAILDGPLVDAFKQRYPTQVLTLPTFSTEEGEAMLAALLEQGGNRRRRLTPYQQSLVLNAFQADGRPLYLALAANACRRWRSWDMPPPLPAQLEALIQHFVEELKVAHGQRIANRALDYLSAARFGGVSNQEMRDLLWRDVEAKAEFDQRKNPDQPEVSSLPTAVWSRLYFDLAPYLTEQGIAGALLHRFYHRIIGEEVARCTLANDTQLIHGNIADYFASQPLYLHTEDRKTPNQRKLSEEPWQRVKAGQLDKAEALLIDFSFLMAKCATNEVQDVLEDYRRLTTAIRKVGKTISKSLDIWNTFFRERVHILRRCCTEWPAHKILLQLATEHGDDSPVTQAAEHWLAAGMCDWTWLRNCHRPVQGRMGCCIAVLEGHDESVVGVLQLPDGSILSWSSDGTLRLWDESSGDSQLVLEGHNNPISGACLLQDGRILSQSQNNTFCLWDGKSGTLLQKYEDIDGVGASYHLLPDGRILSRLRDGTLRLWSIESGYPLTVAEAHCEESDGWSRANLLRDGLILGWGGLKLPLWNVESGEPPLVLDGHTSSIQGACQLSNGCILSWSRDCTLRLWDVKSGASLVILEGHKKTVRGAFPLPDGRILSWSVDGTLRLWDTKSGAPLFILKGHEYDVLGAFLLPDGRILSWSADCTLRLWDAKSGELLITLKGHEHRVLGAFLLSDGRILSWDGRGTLLLWDIESNELPLLLGKHHRFAQVRLLLDGLILSWTVDGTLRLWNAKNALPLRDHEDSAQMNADDARLLPDGRILSWFDTTLRLSDETSGKSLFVLKGHERAVLGASLLPDGRILSWSADGTLRLWDGKSGELLSTLDCHDHTVLGASLLPDGRILSWSVDGTLRLWDGKSGAPLFVLVHVEKPAQFNSWKSVDGASLFPDGRILSWSAVSTLRLWDGKNGKSLFDLKGSGGVHGASLLPDGRILSWSQDHTLRLWDGKNGEPLTALKGHKDLVKGASLLPDGRILSWSDDGTLRLWDGKSGEPLFVLKGHQGPVLSACLLPDACILSWSRDSLCLWKDDKLQSRCVTMARGLTINGVFLPAMEGDLFQGWCFTPSKWTFDDSPVCWCDTHRDPIGLFWIQGGRLVVKTSDKRLIRLQLFKGAQPFSP